MTYGPTYRETRHCVKGMPRRKTDYTECFSNPQELSGVPREVRLLRGTPYFRCYSDPTQLVRLSLEWLPPQVSDGRPESVVPAVHPIVFTEDVFDNLWILNQSVLQVDTACEALVLLVDFYNSEEGLLF